MVKLHAPVLAVFASADAHNAVVFHSDSVAPLARRGHLAADGGATPAVDAGVPSQIPHQRLQPGPLGANLPAEIQETDVPPQAVAISPAGDRVLVTERDDTKKVYGVYLGQFPSLEIQKLTLASPPIAVGVLAAANEGYIAQKNAEGRITFVTFDSGQARTLTGFEIGAGIVDWARARRTERPHESHARAMAVGGGAGPAGLRGARSVLGQPGGLEPLTFNLGTEVALVDQPADRVVLLSVAPIT